MEHKPRIIDDIIDDSIPMAEMPGEVFDQLLEQGHRLLGNSIVRHNFSVCKGLLCRTHPLRIVLSDFHPSKSQRKLLRKNERLEVRLTPIEMDEERKALFVRHTKRFAERVPEDVACFLGPYARSMPVAGWEISVHSGQQLIACSYFHVGQKAMSATYCFFDPDAAHLSPGNFTMLCELLLAQNMGLDYYYHGYCYDVPSQFDYKLNFGGLQTRDWQTGRWRDVARIPERKPHQAI